MKSTRSFRPSRLLAPLAALAACGVVLTAISDAAGQEQAAEPPAAAAVAAVELRPGTMEMRPEDPIRTGSTGPSTVLAPSPPRTLYDVRPNSGEAERARMNALDGIAPDEEDVPPAPAEEPFDLMDGPEDGDAGRRPARPDNLASSPAAAAGALRDSATGPGVEPAGSPARRGRSLLVDAQNNSLRSLDLAVPARIGAVAPTSGVDGRINLPVTGLRPSVPIAADDAFAPVGIRAGSFVLFSTLEQSGGASTNLGRSPGGASGVFSETELSARLLSDWSLHQAEVNGLVAYRRNFEGTLESDPKLSLDGRLRLDIDRLTTATLTGAVQYRREDPTELSAIDAVSDRPEILTYSAGAKVQRAFGRTRLGLDASSLREVKSTDDIPGSLRLDETYTTNTIGARAGYEISPALTPFVAGSVGKRMFDQDRTFAGVKRDSVIPSLRGGLGFDLGEKFLGEFAAGYAWNVPDDEGLETLGAPVIDARIAWSPQRGTDVVLSAATGFEPDTVTSSTSTLYEGGLAVRHRLTARTDLTGALSLAYRDADIRSERETRYAAEAGFVHWLNRTFAVTGLVRHESVDSEAPGGDYDADSIKLGLRAQR